jgi:hypothetical protein
MNHLSPQEQEATLVRTLENHLRRLSQHHRYGLPRWYV